jgi:hypothetical protein
MHHLHRLIPLVAVAVSLPAAAGAKEEAQAEAVRLSEEMGRLAKRTAWRGVDDAYLKLLELERKGAVPTYKDHYVGAEAARALGDINATWQRLNRAKAVQATDEVASWLADIDANYGRAKLSASEKYEGTLALGMAELPFAPDQRQAVTRAQGLVAQSRNYDGLLPFGSYTYGDATFELSATNKEVTVNVLAALASNKTPSADGTGTKPAKPARPAEQTGGGGLAYIGPHIELGGAFTSGGASKAAGVPSPDGFGGMGARVGLGLEVGFTPTLGVLAEVGYHNFFSGGDLAGVTLANPSAYGAGDQFHLGFGWLAGVVKLGDLSIAAGPVYAAGRGETLGASAEGNDALTGSVNPANVKLTGSFRAGGASAGVSYSLFDVGPFRGGVGLLGGAQTDSQRWYSWGQLALTIAPDPRRKG